MKHANVSSLLMLASKLRTIKQYKVYIKILALIYKCLIIDSLWAISYIADNDSKSYPIAKVIEDTENCLKRLLDHLRSEVPDIFVPALRCIGNIMSSDSYELINTLINLRLLDILDLIMTK